MEWDRNVDLETDYGITWDMGPLSNGISTIGDEFPAGSDSVRVDAACAKYPWWIAYCCCDSSRAGLGVADRVPNAGAPAWTDAQILACSSFVAAHNDAVWATGAGIGQGWYFGATPLSRCNIQWPQGSFYVNFPLIGNYGTYKGYGPGQSAPDLNIPANEISFGTRISIWHEEWLSIAPNVGGVQKHIFQSLNWSKNVGGTLYTGVLGLTGGAGATARENYMEGIRVMDVRLDGRKAAAPEAVGGGNTYVTTYEDAGIAVWKAGSNSSFHNVKADNFNNGGFQLPGATPTALYDCRAFYCNYAGIWARGDGTITLVNFECDECPTMVKSEAYVDPTNPSNNLLTPEVTIAATGTKIETAIGSVSIADAKGTMLLDAIGWVIATFNGVDYSATQAYPELLCRVQPYPTGFTSTNSYVNVTGLKVFGNMRTLMHHVAGASNVDSKKWFMGAQYTSRYGSTVHDFVYNSANGGTLTTSSGEAPPPLEVNYGNRQKMLASPLVESWTDSGATGLPIYTNPAS